MKKLYKALVLLVAAMMIAAPVFANGQTEVKSNNGVTTIRLWHAFNEADPNDVSANWLNETVELFNATHDDIHVVSSQAGYSDAYLTKLTTEMAANNAPDVFQTWMSGRLETFVNANRVEPLNDIIFNDPEFSRQINPASLDTATFDGKVYAIPGILVSEVVFYNKAIFDKYGLDVPKTWDDLLNIIDVLNANDVIPIALGNIEPWCGAMSYMMIFDRLFGHEKYEQACLEKKAVWTDPEFAKAAEYYYDLVERGAYNENFNGLSNDDARVFFEQGNAGMYIMGTWDAARLYNALGEDLSFFNWPNMPNGVGNQDTDYILTKEDGFAISSQSKNKEAAAEFLKFMYSEERQAARAEMGAIISTVNVEYDTTKVSSIIKQLTELIPSAKNAMLPWDNPLGQNMGKEFNICMQTVISGGDITEAFKTLQQMAELEYNN